MMNPNRDNCGLRIADCGLKTTTSPLRKAVVASSPHSALRSPHFSRRRGTVLIVTMWIMLVLAGLVLVMAR